MCSVSRRYGSIDIAKGIGMICVVLGHINYGGYCYHIVYPFHMPLFFFISGWLLNEKYSLSVFFVHRARKLLRPYLFVSICVFATSAILYFAGINYSVQYPRNPIDAIVRTLYASGSIYNRTPFRIGTVGAIWFLPALLLSICFVRWVIGLKRAWQQVSIIAVVFLLSIISAKWIWLPFSVQAAGSASVFVYCGWLFNNNQSVKDTTKRYKAIIIVAGIAAWAYDYFFSLFVEVSRAEYLIFLVTVPFAVLICISLLLLSDKLAKCIFVSRILRYLGQNSLIILCFHSFLRCFLTSNIYHFLAPTGTSDMIMYCIVFTIHILFCGLGILVTKRVQLLREVPENWDV